MSLEDKILKAKGFGGGAWASRIYAELGYAAAVSAANSRAYDGLIEKAADTLIAEATSVGGVITADIAKNAESILMPISEAAKSYKVHCVSHAHIDMNWMWGFQETASVTVDTFRTVLDLMKEYPCLTFGQSQASTYKIIEEYAPEMLDEIKARIKEGRWEVTASTWVETDKNMPSGESLARQILYTKRYLSRLLDIPAEGLRLDFEPDTFGHNISVPEICAKGGIKYYYHCRGNKSDEFIYRWRARSGAELLVWREPEWYNYDINPEMFRKVPQLCARYGIKDFLSVYGVGDHGGGPTRRDVERLITISKWPIMPTLVFSTYGAFYAELEKTREKFPVIEGELNFIFTGCYTTQSRIKAANRIAEERMYDSEVINTLSSVMAGGRRYTEGYARAWEQILFNQFHDILPGSGVIDTREYALGQFQRAMAAVQSNASLSMRALAEAIDVSALSVNEEAPDSISEGAAVGYGTNAESGYRLPNAERGSGKRRIFHLFNTTRFDFDGMTDITVWDWNYDAHRARFADHEGNAAECKPVTSQNGYWGHRYTVFAVKVRVPAMGYATYVLDEESAADYVAPVAHREHWHTDEYTDGDLVLENGRIRAVFDHKTMQIVSLTDKASGLSLIDRPSATFRLIHENLTHGMTAWRVGDAMTVEALNETQNVVVSRAELCGLRKTVEYSLKFGKRSSLSVTVTLDEESPVLDFNIKVDFHEICDGESIPQLNFTVPVSYAVTSYRYDVPFGTVDRTEIKHDVPACSFAAALPETGEASPTLTVITNSKYGFRGADNSVSVSCIRSSRDPDPYPEYGKHNIRIGIGAVESASPSTLCETALHYLHPLAVCSARPGKGTLPPSARLFKLEGDALVSAVKTAEDSDGTVIRLYDASGKGGEIKLGFFKAPLSVSETDINEKIISDLNVSGSDVSVRIEPYAIKTLLVRF